ncbi:hypothetical protein VTK56DRAFT_5832 [Thermocarpiscus australiensis]
MRPRSQPPPLRIHDPYTPSASPAPPPLHETHTFPRRRLRRQHLDGARARVLGPGGAVAGGVCSSFISSYPAADGIAHSAGHGGLLGHHQRNRKEPAAARRWFGVADQAQLAVAVGVLDADLIAMHTAFRR